MLREKGTLVKRLEISLGKQKQRGTNCLRRGKDKIDKKRWSKLI